jgi:hypothetical protein
LPSSGVHFDVVNAGVGIAGGGKRGADWFLSGMMFDVWENVSPEYTSFPE